MKVSVKNLLFGALIGCAAVGASTAMPGVVQAAGPCEPCELQGSIKSGYMVASGLTYECIADPVECADQH